MKPTGVWLNKRFFEDHEERGLPTPTTYFRGPHFVGVNRDDPAIKDLVEDARFYAEGVQTTGR